MHRKIITLQTRNLTQSLKDGGCFECQTSCQSACKTSCGVANQSCVTSRSEGAKHLEAGAGNA